MTNEQLAKLMLKIIKTNINKLRTCREIVKELPKHSFSTNDFHNTLTKLCHLGLVNKQKISNKNYYWHRGK